MMRAVMLFGSDGFSSRSFSSGNSGVRSSNRGRVRAFSGSPPLTVSIRSSAGFFSLRPAGRLQPGDVVALAQPELPGLLDRDVDVVAARQVAVDAQEAVALVAQIEVAGNVDRLHVERRCDLVDTLGTVEPFLIGALRAFAPALVAATAPAAAVAALALAVAVALVSISAAA